MAKLFRHLLILGLWLGLAGNGVAVASPACGMMIRHHAVAVAGCDEAKMAAAPDTKGMTPGCMTIAGGAVVVAPDEPASAATPIMGDAALAVWPDVPGLRGRMIVPEPEPPTHRA